MKTESQFEKKYFFKINRHGWRLPEPNTMFREKKWAIPDLMRFKDKLNEVKSKLNDLPLEKWHKHTAAMNPAGAIQKQLREMVAPELLTQAWCKFFETVCSFPLIPSHSIKAKELNTVHLCEAPGAFVAALNHYINLNLPQIKWDWMATTLNPHCESNDPEKTIFDDRFIIPTNKHWTFGADHTGDILVEANMHHILNEAKQRGLSGKGTLMLVTADGSIDCQFNPGEQESLVCTLHLCEATTALLLLDKGGSLLLKAFTVFEAENVCLLYLLALAFESLVAWKPATSREGNSEMYLVCMNYLGQSQLSPWLEVLCKYYSHNFSNGTMFSLESIPKTFLDQVVECAETFMTFQMNTVKQLHSLYDTSGQSSFNQKIKYKRHELSNLEIWQTLYKALSESDAVLKTYSPFLYEENKLSLEFAGRSCKVIPLNFDLTLQDVSLGLPLKKVLVSKFCHNWLLHLYDQIMSFWKHLEETSANTNQEGNVETRKNTSHSKICEGEEVVNEVKMYTDNLQEKSDVRGKRSSTLKNDIPGLPIKTQSCVKFVDQSSCVSERKVIYNEKQDSNGHEHILKPLQDGTSPCFIWCNEMSSGCFGSGLKELLNTLKRVEENGNLLILKALPMLTRVEVGIIYLLSQLFQWLWFIWSNTEENPRGERPYSILLHGRLGCSDNQMKVLNFLGDLSKLAANEEKKANPQTLLAIVPVHLLCEQDFYQCIVCMNHLILQNSAKDILSDCSERMRMQENYQ